MSEPREGARALRRAGLSGAGVGVGHLDSGVDAAHPSLAGRVAAYRYFDVDGRVVQGKHPSDDSGHGTHTAGIIAGLAPRARLHVAHVLEHGRVLARVVRGLDWLLDEDVAVVAMPIGVRGDAPLFGPQVAALAERGVLAIAPIGNLGAGEYHVPGAEAAVLSVGAIGDDGRIPRWSGSRKGPGGECLEPDLLAPGVDVESAAPGGGAEVFSGTSMAAAFVAGVAALLFEAVPTATAAQVRAVLCSTARPLSKGRRHRCRGGVIDPCAALARLRAQPEAAELGAAVLEPSRAHDRIDPRLARQLRWTPDSPVPAIAMFRDMSPGRARRVIDELGRRYPPATRVSSLRHGRLVLLEAHPGLLRALAQHPAVGYLSAQDVDLDSPR